MDSLYAVNNAVTVTCRLCRQPIDIWLDHGLEISRAGVTTHPEAARRLCGDCLARTLPIEQWQTLAPAYEVQRKPPREAGIPPWVTTYVLSNEGKLGTWSDGFLAVLYGVHVLGWDSESALRQPYMTIVPTDPSELPLSFVFFAATVYHYQVKLSWLKCIWPFQDLTLPERFEVVNGLDAEVPDSDLAKLMRGRRFLRETVTRRGSPPGPRLYTPDEFRYEVPRVRQRLRTKNGRKPFDNEVAAEMGMSTPTFQRYKKEFLPKPKRS
jgi:hypothetical protein